MVDKEEKREMKCGKCRGGGCCCSGAVYGLGLIGALVYYLQQAFTFKLVFIAIGKAIIWPALLIYKVLGLLGM